MATAERSDLADLLATLTPEQWEAASLCEGWRVRDVVAHVLSFDDVTLLGTLRRAVRARFVDVNQVGVDELASLSTGQLRDRLRDRLRPRAWPPPSAGGSPCSMSPSTTRTSAAPWAHRARSRPIVSGSCWPTLYAALNCRPGTSAEGCAWLRATWTGVTAPGRRSAGRPKPYRWRSPVGRAPLQSWRARGCPCWPAGSLADSTGPAERPTPDDPLRTTVERPPLQRSCPCRAPGSGRARRQAEDRRRSPTTGSVTV
ncbi:maleylpyruvate isomerase family mycothiol-dependent enzyme [Propionicimonas sp.]|uniref:maleylpyruvate isomerase family mycothiol-dependent enzyme n=1 Tax=Propionicimonas sp. TaxID=1955623 RepID=UPI0039E4B5CA